ncbi:Aste57867_12384 [Aphanomyces stellatus]|uniref:Aste57867_12384 protein n=1 Tax=Aphanomyces stellatus TaxID=120398 RepID=A0A485KVU3_9STRA|nr:hypothetical protein As57867_012338 [Aphanomyces stellatus]VFT89235.1 Aste57867_12384 [Aphanomyces stellatus]
MRALVITTAVAAILATCSDAENAHRGGTGLLRGSTGDVNRFLRFREVDDIDNEDDDDYPGDESDTLDEEDDSSNNAVYGQYTDGDIEEGPDAEGYYNYGDNDGDNNSVNGQDTDDIEEGPDAEGYYNYGDDDGDNNANSVNGQAIEEGPDADGYYNYGDDDGDDNANSVNGQDLEEGPDADGYYNYGDNDGDDNNSAYTVDGPDDVDGVYGPDASMESVDGAGVSNDDDDDDYVSNDDVQSYYSNVAEQAEVDLDGFESDEQLYDQDGDYTYASDELNDPDAFDAWGDDDEQ